MKQVGRLTVASLVLGMLTASPVLAQPDGNLKPVFGDAKLNAGFPVDPHQREVNAGGDVVTMLGDVKAHVSQAPSYKLHYTKGTYPLTFHVKSGSDTTLLIKLPNGKWIANDDAVGLNPLIRLEKPDSGRYDIWVGTFNKNLARGTLYITELNVTADPVTKKSDPAPVKGSLTDEGNGTFKVGNSGLVWLKNPKSIPRINSMDEAKALVAKLKSGDYGLKDGSKAGDWRLPTTDEWVAARRSEPFCLIGWEKNSSTYSRGYVASSGLTAWGPDGGSTGGGFDSVAWRKQNQGYVWPVRASASGGVQADGPLDISLKPRFGTANLKSGFTPDPYEKKVSTGNSINTTLGGVSCYVNKNPDFKLFFEKGNDGLPLIFSVESGSDTTLLINLPNGKWIANDDGGGRLNPRILLERPESGRYDIYVGTILRGVESTAVLKISEVK